jgi:hypothetical protein
MTGPRRSYEARVLLVPLGASAVDLAAQMARAGLDGLVTAVVLDGAPDDGPLVVGCRPLSERGWRPTADVPLSEVVAEADMVVLLAADLAQVDARTCREAAQAARTAGRLMAALVVGAEHGDTPSGNSALAVLREAVDTLVAVRSLRLAAPFLDGLRGGPRAAAS